MKVKKSCITVLLAAACALSGCGDHSAAEAAREEEPYPEPDEVVSSLEDAGFEVERTEGFEELEIDVSRIKAVSGEEYLDVCYDVSSADDIDKIVDYYTQNYQKYNLVVEDEAVYCYSGDLAAQCAGLHWD